jgi:hypothetical protein
MEATARLTAEDRLAEFLMLPLFARESTWAEIVEDLEEPEPKPVAPVTLRWPARDSRTVQSVG